MRQTYLDCSQSAKSMRTFDGIISRQNVCMEMCSVASIPLYTKTIHKNNTFYKKRCSNLEHSIGFDDRKVYNKHWICVFWQKTID